MTDNTNYVVQVRSAYKSYGSNDCIFRGLNMTVEKGTIYALLGPSGCGKTTLLKCILGRSQLDAGDVIIKAKNKSEIGYMPQGISLVGEITIKETFNYYGWLNGIRGDKLEEKKSRLFSCFEIPPESSKIKHLSGGQQRRVSLCIALLHNPEFLILDEPTVGLDPILSHRIWQYLVELSTINKKTIILTTHYIEEARHSNKVGMMRGGVLVAEGKAESIMNEYNSNTLEEAFIKLSIKQECTELQTEIKKPKEIKKRNKTKLSPLNEQKLFTLNGFISYFIKNIYFMKKGFLGWFILFIIPISSCFFFEYSIGHKPTGLRLAVVNNEVSVGKTKCGDPLNDICNTASCGFISYLQQNYLIINVPYNDSVDARANFGRDKLYGIIQIPENFTQSLYHRILYFTKSSDYVVDHSEISVWLDSSNKINAAFLMDIFRNGFYNYLQVISNKCNWTLDHFMVPIHFNKPVFGTNDLEFTDYCVPGVLLLLGFFLPIAHLLPLLADKRDGIIERSLISGFSTLEILLSYFTISWMFFLVQSFLNIFMIYGVFGHLFQGSIILGGSLLILVGACGLSMALLLAVAVDNEIPAVFFVMGYLVVMLVASGLFWPIEAMHNLLKPFTWALPLTNAAKAYRSISLKSWTLSNPEVLIGFLTVISWIFSYFLLTIIIVKVRKGIGHVK